MINRFNPLTGEKEITPEYKNIVLRALKREARRMRYAIQMRIFFLNLSRFRLECRKLIRMIVWKFHV